MTKIYCLEIPTLRHECLARNDILLARCTQRNDIFQPFHHYVPPYTGTAIYKDEIPTLRFAIAKCTQRNDILLEIAMAYCVRLAMTLLLKL